MLSQLRATAFRRMDVRLYFCRPKVRVSCVRTSRVVAVGCMIVGGIEGCLFPGLPRELRSGLRIDFRRRRCLLFGRPQPRI